jgi:hypothetical protein
MDANEYKPTTAKLDHYKLEWLMLGNHGSPVMQPQSDDEPPLHKPIPCMESSQKINFASQQQNRAG